MQPAPAAPRGVAVVGSINVDLTVSGSPLPRAGETVQAERFSMQLGGKGANQAVAAVRAGAPTYLIGAVGEDPFADLALAALRADGVDTAGVAALPGHTGIAHIRVDTATGENDIAIVAEANARLGPEAAADGLRALAGRIGVVLLQLEIGVPTVLRAAQVAGELGCLVVLDPAPARALPDALYAAVDVVTPNETEAEVLTGVAGTDSDAAVAAGRWFTDRGAGAAVVTRSGRGVVVVRPAEVRRYDAYAVEPVDTTAAGDAFTGTLGAALAGGEPWEEALRRARAAGALAVTVGGASPSLPTAAQVDAFLAGRGD